MDKVDPCNQKEKVENLDSQSCPIFLLFLIESGFIRSGRAVLLAGLGSGGSSLSSLFALCMDRWDIRESNAWNQSNDDSPSTSWRIPAVL